MIYMDYKTISEIYNSPPKEFNEPVFKHLCPEHAEAMLLKGEVLISSVKSYKGTIRREIEDKAEGVKFGEWAAQKFETYKIESNGTRTKYNNDGVMQFLPSTFGRPISYLDQYTYCLSLSSAPNLFSDYTACIRVFDISGFGKAIYRELLKKKITKAGACGAKILYIQGRRVPITDKIPAYWIKDTRYEHEQEYRFIFPSTIENRRENFSIILPPALIQIKNISQYCERIR